MFDTGDLFQIQEGIIGSVNNSAVLVFHYATLKEDDRFSKMLFLSFQAVRLSEPIVQKYLCSMVDRDEKSMIVMREDRSIVIVVGGGQESTRALQLPNNYQEDRKVFNRVEA